MDGLFRRGGMWWARLVVPVRLRAQAGRREFVQTTGTHEYSVAKLVAAALLARWRRQLYEWERGKLDNEKLLRLVEGGHTLSQTQYIVLKEASAAIGLDRSTLLSQVVSGRLDLYVVLGARARGHVLPKQCLELVDPVLGMEGGVVVPPPDHMPPEAQEASFPGQTLRVSDGPDVAGVLLADALESACLVLLDAPSPPGWVFAPAETLQVPVDELALLTDQVEVLRVSIAARVMPERLEHARAERNAMLQTQLQREQAVLLEPKNSATVVTGKWADKKFSEAVDGYCSSPDGLPGNLASKIDQRQRKAGLMLFSEFMGDLRLSEIDGDVLRKFRDGPLKTIPGKANHLPKEIRRSNMIATIEALVADGRDWPLLSADMRHERMQWLARLFLWLYSKEYLSVNPMASLQGETGLTKAEKIAAKQSSEDDDEEGREQFTPEQLQAIFSQQHYQTGHGRHVKKPACWYGFEFWLPLLGLYAGLRIKEASQMHLTDVKLVDGVWCLDINRRTADKSIKNDQSLRIVPIHPELVRLGFLHYCDRLRECEYRRVFPELSWSTANAKYAKETGRKMSMMLNSLGMPRDGTLVFHCLRHNTNNALMRVPVSAIPRADEHLKKYIRLKIMGHEVGKDANVKHYTNTSSAEMAALVAAVEYDLPVIHEFDTEFALQQIQVALMKKKDERRGCEDMGPLN